MTKTNHNFLWWLMLLAAFYMDWQIAVATPSWSESLALPNHKLTPGVDNPNVTQANIGRTICKDGWTGTVRPSESFTNRLKLRLLPQYGHHTDNPLSFELDHLIPLEIGGSPQDEKNLWPQPYAGVWGARKKDVLEKKLNRMVCAGTVTLKQAQSAISTDWVAAYKRYVPTSSKVHHVHRGNSF